MMAPTFFGSNTPLIVSQSFSSSSYFYLLLLFLSSHFSPASFSHRRWAGRGQEPPRSQRSAQGEIIWKYSVVQCITNHDVQGGSSVASKSNVEFNEVQPNQIGWNQCSQCTTIAQQGWWSVAAQSAYLPCNNEVAPQQCNRYNSWTHQCSDVSEIPKSAPPH